MQTIPFAASLAATALLALGGHAVAPPPVPAAPTVPTVPTVATGAAQADSDRLPDPIGPMRIPDEAADELRLFDVVKELGRLTHQQIVVSDGARQALSQTSIGIVQGGFDVPAGDVYAFVEGLLFHHGFYLSVVNSGQFPVLSIDWAFDKTGLRTLHWLQIDAAQVETYGTHPALLVQVTVDTAPIDARQLGSSLRGMMTDSLRQGIFPISAEAGVILRGTGRQVADMARLVDQARAFAAANAPEPTPEPSGGEDR